MSHNLPPTSSPSSSPQEIKAYYDEHVTGKLAGFVEGNERVERAWLTVDQWAPTNPRRILEIGCGIGDICWRMTRRWPGAEVTGMDISPKSLEIARELFTSPRLSFCEGPLVKGKIAGQFDLVVLIDVYEHIAAGDRLALHEALAEIQDESGRMVLTFPTPRHLAWLKEHQPEQIQPVDEDIGLGQISKLAQATGNEVLLYQEIGVWHEGDYAHAVLGRREGWAAVAMPPARSMKRRTLQRIRRLVSGGGEPLIPSRSQRLARVHQQLGLEYYPGRQN
jgi:SAM-dependent methyltransferase